MQVIADIILACGALGVAFYCFVLSRRLKRFNNLEHGVGGAVAVLSAQVDDLERALDKARKAAETSGLSLTELTERADGVARRLELHVAAMHDLTEPAVAPRPQAERSVAAPATEAAGPAAVEPAPGPTADPASDSRAAAPVAVPQPAAPHSAIATPEPISTDPAPSAQSAPAAAPAARPVRSFFATARQAEAPL